MRNFTTTYSRANCYGTGAVQLDSGFVLHNEPPKHRPAKIETAKGKQRDLFIGLGDLPGQTYLIPEVNTD